MLFENQCGIIAPATQSAFRRYVNGQRASANLSFACQRVKGSPRSGSRSKNQAVSHGRHPAFHHFNSPVTHKWFISISPMFYPRPRWAWVLSPTWHNASVTACVVISIAHKRLNSGVAPAKRKRLIYCHWFRHYAVDLQEIIALRGTRNSIKNATARNAECQSHLIWDQTQHSGRLPVNPADCTDKFIFLRELHFRTWFMPSCSPERPACVVFGRGTPSSPSSNLRPLFARTMGIFLNQTLTGHKKRFNFRQHSEMSPTVNDRFGVRSVNSAAELNTEGRRQFQEVSI